MTTFYQQQPTFLFNSSLQAFNPLNQVPPGLQQVPQKPKKRLLLKIDAKEFILPSQTGNRDQNENRESNLNEKSGSRRRLPACRNASDAAYTGINSGRGFESKVSNSQDGLKEYFQTMEEISAKVKEIFAEI